MFAFRRALRHGTIVPSVWGTLNQSILLRYVPLRPWRKCQKSWELHWRGGLRRVSPTGPVESVVRKATEETDNRKLQLLRWREKRPRCCGAECGDKISSSHCLAPGSEQGIVAGEPGRPEVVKRRSVMSALGQKRTLGHLRAMSALPPKADIAERHCHVRFVPEADISPVIRSPHPPA